MTSKPAVCVVNPYEHGGGAEYQMSLLIDALVASDRYQVHFLTHFIDTRSRARNYKVEKIGTTLDIPRLGYLMDARALYEKLSELAPRAIYQRVACAYTGICAAYATRRSVPFIWHVAHDTDVSLEQLDPGRNFVRRKLERAAIAFGARRASHIVCQTQHQADLLRENFARTAAAVVPNFHPAAAEPIDKSGPLTVLWIANLKPWKRPEAFLRLAESFAAQDDVRFLMVGAPVSGPGNRRWQDALMRQMRDCRNVTYLAHRTQEEVNALLARAHIFVNTSQYEGFPNTFVQAWLREVAVVSLSVDPDQVLERDKVGILARSMSGLSTAVRGLIDDPEARGVLARRGRLHAQRHHSLDNAVRLVELIERSGLSHG